MKYYEIQMKNLLTEMPIADYMNWNGHYGNTLWVDQNQQIQKINRYAYVCQNRNTKTDRRILNNLI